MTGPDLPGAGDPCPLDIFDSVLTATGGEVQRVASMEEVVEAVVGAMDARGPSRLLYEPWPWAEARGLPGRLRERGVEPVAVEEAGEEAGELRVGLTGAELAVAETGTLLVGGRPGGWGLASVLPWIHLVVLPVAAIRLDLASAYREFVGRLTAGEGDWVWITGPSRTADIGHTLVLGAHGPNTLRVLVWTEEEGTNGRRPAALRAVSP